MDNNDMISTDNNIENSEMPSEGFIDIATLFGEENIEKVINANGEAVYMSKNSDVDILMNSGNDQLEENTTNNEESTQSERNIPLSPESIPLTPEFSDGSDINNDPEANGAGATEIPIGNPGFMAPDYRELFNTYKPLFENLTSDVERIDKKYDDLLKAIDSTINKNIKELHSGIKVTQIYSKLFTNIIFGIDILLAILIIILFIIK